MSGSQSPPRNVFDLSRDARDALSRGLPDRAIGFLKEALTIEPKALGLWLNLAAAHRQAGDAKAALVAVDEALSIEPRDFSALLMKASLHDRAGDLVEAGRLYGLALLFRPPTTSDPAIQQALARAETVNADYLKGQAAAMDAFVAERLGADARLETNARRFLDFSAGRTKLYRPEPSTYLYPGLPAYEFYDRAVTPWIERFEAYSEVVRGELEKALKTRPDLFSPYVNEPSNVPIDQWKELNRSPRWSALPVIRSGVMQPYSEELFPKTLEALSLLPQPQVPGRTPSAMFSALQPKTRIPPHTGVSNARLVVHLPLIIPPDCSFRVGSETRRWEVGKAWVFDDTIDHEARNDSDELRVILIADIWNVFMTEQDREVYSSIVAAVDAYNGWSADKAQADAL